MKQRSFELPPPERTIIPPIHGWKPRTYYSARVAWNKHNVIHLAIFYTGFLNGPGGTPGGYNQIWNPTYDWAPPHQNRPGNYTHEHGIEKIHYLEILCELTQLSEDASTG